MTKPSPHLERYRPLVGEALLSSIYRAASSLAGLRVLHLNTTAQGGGVAELLHGLLPLMEELGIPHVWKVLPLDDTSRRFTAQLVDLLQNMAHDPLPLAGQRGILEALSHTVTMNQIEQYRADLYVVHVFHLAPLSMMYPWLRPAIWMCHVDTAHPDPQGKAYLDPFLPVYQICVFTTPLSVFPDLPREKVRIITPTIDPFSAKNTPLSRKKGLELLAGSGIDPSRPLLTQVARFGNWKNPWQVFEVYRLVKQALPTVQAALDRKAPRSLCRFRGSREGKAMGTFLTSIIPIIASASIGLLIGLEREWAHKEAGGRSFTIAALLGTLSWLIGPSFALVEVGVVGVIVICINLLSLREQQPVEVTTSLALAATNLLGILVGMGAYFLAFTCVLLIAVLLSWKPEMVAFTSTLTVREICGALLLGFVTTVGYPLLPQQVVDPWNLINPLTVWLTGIIVSGFSFLNYLLLRHFGTKGTRYSALLGGLVHSAATSALLGEELERDPAVVATATSSLLLADVAMMGRDGLLAALFSWPFGLQGSIPTFLVLGTILIVMAIVALLVVLRSEPKAPRVFTKMPLHSSLSLHVVLGFGLLFLTLKCDQWRWATAFRDHWFPGGDHHGRPGQGDIIGCVGRRTYPPAGRKYCCACDVLRDAGWPGGECDKFYAITRHCALSGRLLLLLLPVVLLGGGVLLPFF